MLAGPLLQVPLLAPGARVALVAPSGPLRGPADLERAESNARELGWEPVVGRSVLARDGYLAGTDEERLDDFNQALRDPSIDGVWCIRGGYGATRIIDRIDYNALRVRPRPVLGFSDITALHAAIGRVCGIQSFHGPTGRSVLNAFTRYSLERALVFGADPGGTAHGARTIKSGRVAGRLAGGNLALLSSLAGTPYMPDLRGAILVLEDVNEPVYRMDRMLRQLQLAGTLNEIAAIAFGACTGCDPAPEHQGPAPPRTLDDVLREYADALKVPCLTGLPIGHIDEQWTLPLGAVATIDADALTLTVEMTA